MSLQTWPDNKPEWFPELSQELFTEHVALEKNEEWVAELEHHMADAIEKATTKKCKIEKPEKKLKKIKLSKEMKSIENSDAQCHCVMTWY